MRDLRGVRQLELEVDGPDWDGPYEFGHCGVVETSVGVRVGEKYMERRKEDESVWLSR